MRVRLLLAASAILTTVHGCASVPPPPPAEATASSPVRWTATLPPTRSRSESAMAPSELTKAYGSVTLTAADGSPTRSHVKLSVTAPVQSQSLRWAILPGPCGANTLPLIGFEAFPVIEVGATGRGSLDADLPIALPSQGEYHVNVYFQGQQISDVMTCGALRLAGRS